MAAGAAISNRAQPLGARLFSASVGIAVVSAPSAETKQNIAELNVPRQLAPVNGRARAPAWRERINKRRGGIEHQHLASGERLTRRGRWPYNE